MSDPKWSDDCCQGCGELLSDDEFFKPETLCRACAIRSAEVRAFDAGYKRGLEVGARIEMNEFRAEVSRL